MWFGSYRAKANYARMGCFLSCLRGTMPDGNEPSDGTKGPELEPNGESSLSPTQARVMSGARARAKEASNAALPRLAQNFQRLGYDKDVLQTVLKYLRDAAPIIIHFDPFLPIEPGCCFYRTVLDAFLADSHCRSVFETEVTASNTAQREEKERTLFAGQYDGETAPGERPKYGSVNLYNMPGGTARDFGDCYFELKAQVRARCTFTYGPSTEDLAQTVATCEHLAHVLVRFTDEEIRCLVERNWYAPTSDPRINFLIEAQVHGPIEFVRDVKELRYDKELWCKWKRLHKLANEKRFKIRSYELTP
ncbi:hypothetical protein KFL_000550310 [Klebsormidium nitens]|uniref:Uncharacterized protein n=1 Tax=Klebsormidium nitens TaxID=105231 RepID=A0A1Y1HU29_KLENI|nr:hypothetical protein KFL_000550310 [Klebsormidium nitens]|eukprot:GAQ80501.1 hypothetical protein KFL_000550310 [Klebsormidium nitens]